MSVIIVRRGLQGNRGLTGLAAPETITVAQNIQKVTAVADNIEAIEEVSEHAANIGVVAANVGAVNTVADDIAAVVATSANITAVTAVAADIASIDAVNAGLASILLVAADISAVALAAANMPAIIAAPDAAAAAQQWATKIDAPVSGGLYGARYYALQAAAAAVQNNWTATAAPTATDDENAGYAEGSKWYVELTGDIHICVRKNAGSAVWVDTGVNLDDLGSAAFVSEESLRQIPGRGAALGATYTLAASDAGGYKIKTSGTAVTVTIPANADVAIPDTSAITIINFNNTADITLARGSGVALYTAGDTANADRVIKPRGVATLLKVGTNNWMLLGGGVE